MQSKWIPWTCALTAVVAASTASAADYRPLTISSVSVIGADNTELFGHAAFEFGREASDGAGQGPGNDIGTGDYDNLRLGPLGFRYGLTDDFEYGAYFTFNSNADDDDGAPDDSGLEGITGFAKLQLNQHFALEVGARAGGADDVAPYPNDGLDFYVNLPMQRSLGPGLVYGELGYTIQDNDIGGTYANWGIGYAHPLDTGTNLNVELRGDESPTGDGNHMDLIVGAGLQVEQVHLRPYLGLGLYDASPDVSFGIGASLPL
ncbi:hypothetical protein [Halorhodospira halophila]|uniref:Outer membrane protein beta-barrel domain-containing protein n=1 Tax=Halorhodospira halophila (strain DSM 244 / SL1) TaxID=349124 RepID=A1WZQ9_HALHL|nr:hypothetical protein [Halorhodospira halophila]ABM63171.1 hypothetical protein Hhal_2408 [Halorhodospira halophila SL1]MBK1729350.1 hypothetical protein [Halorhodospira halophila]